MGQDTRYPFKKKRLALKVRQKRCTREKNASYLVVITVPCGDPICVNLLLARHSLARRLVHLRFVSVLFASIRSLPSLASRDGGSIRGLPSCPFAVPFCGY